MRTTIGRSALLGAALLAVAAGAPRDPDRTQWLKDGLRPAVEKTERTAADATKPLTLRDLPNAALAELALGQDPARAESLVRLLFAQQDMDPASPSYGDVPWQIRGKAVSDANSIEFSMQALGPLLIRHRERLSPGFVAEAAPHLKAAVAAIERHAVPVAYTNIFLMKTVNLILLGRVLADAAIVAAGEKSLDEWLDFTRRHGIAEYDSPTYYKVDSDDLLYGFLYAEKPETRQKLAAALDYLWTDIAANYFPGQESLSGPHSRDYDFLTGRGGIDAFFVAYGLSALSAKPKELDLETIALLQSELDGGYRPGPEILALAARPERWVTQTWGDAPGKDRSNFVTPDFAIGGASGDYCPYDKPVSIQLRADRRLTDVSIVVDDSGEPYGKKKVANPDGHSKPRHLPLRAVSVQSRGTLLTSLSVSPDKRRPSRFFETDVLLPLAADEIDVDGRPVDVSRPGRTRLSSKSVVSARAGGATALVRVLSAQGCQGEHARLSLTIDKAGLKYKTARLVVSHHDPKAGAAPAKCRARVLLLLEAAPAADEARALANLRAATATESAKKDVWTASARVGATTLELTRDLRAKTILRRAVNGRDLEFSPLAVDGKPKILSPVGP